jgi:hypothetical protein
VTTTSACVDRHVLPALFSTQFVNKVYEFKTPFVKWKQIFEKMCENNEENIPPEVFETARKATLNLLPQKSRQQYELGCVQKCAVGIGNGKVMVHPRIMTSLPRCAAATSHL